MDKATKKQEKTKKKVAPFKKKEAPKISNFKKGLALASLVGAGIISKKLYDNYQKNNTEEAKALRQNQLLLQQEQQRQMDIQKEEEIKRQEELQKQMDIQKEKEIKRQEELQRQMDIQRQQELQKEQERQRKEEFKRQQELQKQQEQQRKEEFKRQQELQKEELKNKVNREELINQMNYIESVRRNVVFLLKSLKNTKKEDVKIQELLGEINNAPSDKKQIELLAGYTCNLYKLIMKKTYQECEKPFVSSKKDCIDRSIMKYNLDPRSIKKALSVIGC